MLGIPTVLITVGPEASKLMRPPRAMYPVGFKIGNSLGKPGMKELQRKILQDALLMLSEPAHPGEVQDREYPEYQV